MLYQKQRTYHSINRIMKLHIEKYQKEPSKQNWNALSSLFAPLCKSLTRKCSPTLGRQDAKQSVSLAFFEAIQVYDISRNSSYIVKEIQQDTWDRIRRKIVKETRWKQYTVPLKDICPARESTFLYENPFSLLQKAVQCKMISEHMRQMIVLRYKYGLNFHEIADRFQLPYERVRRKVNYTIKRLGGTAKGKCKRA